MKAPTAVPAATRDRQRLATDPAASAFVSANAGSGKTYVLTRRVIRLLLAGSDPARILCLTFTKAAAAEMANRVFEVLGAWATLPDADLGAAIAEIEDEAPSPDRLAAARRLFARALETPGGLKVQTIHAFAEALLQRFSVEANLSGRFEVLDDRGAALLRAEAKDRTVRETVADPEGPVAAALASLLAVVPDATVDAALSALVDEREAFSAWILRHGTLEAALAALPSALGVPGGAGREEILAAYGDSPDVDAAHLSDLLPLLERAGASSVKLAEALRAVGGLTGPALRAAWSAIFCTGKGEPKSGRAIVNAVESALPGARARFEREAERVAGLERSMAALETADRTAALARLADRMIGHYQAAKAAAGALDYDDLILKAAGLLSRSDAAAWVQYKLDEGLDHILVDEAQDTSPKQWEIVEALAGDFFAGAGARGRTVRTLFAVGDEKQSIYSFQGAAPHLFDAMRRTVEARIGGAGGRFHHIELNLSFRSTPDVVKGVDRIFAAAAAHAGLTAGEPRPPVHETVRSADPGLVEVWPETVADTAPEPERWEDPVDRTGRGSAESQLAARIADEVAGWIARGERLPATGERIRPGDVLILVRKRGAFVEAVNRALKDRRLPIAGADRIDVVGHIVVQDMLAAARVALLPEDDLTLATVAKSPLGGLSEDDLFDLAEPRRGSLWAAVRAAAEAGHEGAGRLRDAVERWMGRADTTDPFAFFASMAGPDGARAAYRARFGREADEVIDEFLALALAFEERETATLQGFVCRLAAVREEVKREVDGKRDEVRVMTVHGAKGLEAPVVFLVDPGDPPAGSRFAPPVVTLGDEPGAPLVWVQSGLKPGPVEAELDRHREGQEHEYRRLLYVGLTRARDRLIVTGIRRDRVKPEGRWHTLATEALAGEAESVKGPDGAVRCWRWRTGPDRPAHPPVESAATSRATDPLPDWLHRVAAPEAAATVLTPSSAARRLQGGVAFADRRDGLARARAADEKDAAARGRLVHRLFEVLPAVEPSARREKALAWLTRQVPVSTAAEREALLAPVLAILDDPAHAAVFGPGSRAEIGISGELPGADGRPLPVLGQIDRLLVSETEILVVDFKTNRVVPETVPEDYVVQLALYRAVLARRWPDRPVRCAILWTEAARLDEVDAATLDAAAARLVTQMGSDPEKGRS
jgi:ATP-dependent helicase/nuclease subunit A